MIVHDMVHTYVITCMHDVCVCVAHMYLQYIHNANIL